MRVEQVSLYSAGSRIAGTMLLPADTLAPVPCVLQGPGWLGLRDARLYAPYHDALVAAGIAVLAIDYRGFGGSEGDATLLDPREQVADLQAALTFLESRREVDSDRIGVFGSGGTGGGNAVFLAGIDTRVKAAVSQVPIADGRDWLRRMRREHEWIAFLDRLRHDRETYVATGDSELVSPRDELVPATPERKTTTIKSDVDSRVPQRVALQSAEAIMAYRPLDVVSSIAPRALMLIAVEHDSTTPEDHAFALYQKAGSPKRLVIQRGTSHYAAYDQFRDVVTPLIVEWFTRHLVGSLIEVHEEIGASVVYLPESPTNSLGGRG